MIALSDALMSVATDPEGCETMLWSFPLRSLPRPGNNSAALVITLLHYCYCIIVTLSSLCAWVTWGRRGAFLWLKAPQWWGKEKLRHGGECWFNVSSVARVGVSEITVHRFVRLQLNKSSLAPYSLITPYGKRPQILYTYTCSISNWYRCCIWVLIPKKSKCKAIFLYEQ